MKSLKVYILGTAPFVAIHPVQRTVHSDEANIFFADMLREFLNGHPDALVGSPLV